jgi:Integrase core domain
VVPSIGSVADSFDNAMAESLIGTFKAELIDRQRWRTRDDVEFAVVEWVAWYNTRRLHSSIGDIPPAEFETNYYASAKALQPTDATPPGACLGSPRSPRRFNERRLPAAAFIALEMAWAVLRCRC